MSRLYDPCSLVVVREKQPENVQKWLLGLEWGEEESDILVTSFHGEDPDTLVRITLPAGCEYEIVGDVTSVMLTGLFELSYPKFLENGGRVFLYSLESGEKVAFAQGCGVYQSRIALIEEEA